MVYYTVYFILIYVMRKIQLDIFMMLYIEYDLEPLHDMGVCQNYHQCFLLLLLRREPFVFIEQRKTFAVDRYLPPFSLA